MRPTKQNEGSIAKRPRFRMRFPLRMLATALVSLAGGLWTDLEYSQALKRQAEAGDMKAQFDLALCYHSGAGIDVDNETAHLWLKKASIQGHAEARFLLNTLYRD